MLNTLGARLRLSFACAAGVLLLLGFAGSAHATALVDLKSGEPVALSASVTFTPGTVTSADGRVDISGGTLSYGDIGTGEGVTGVATADKLTLTGGSFTFADEVATGTFTPDDDRPLTFGLGDAADADATGSLVPAPAAASAPAVRAFASIPQSDAEDAALGLLPTVPAGTGRFTYSIDVTCCGSGATLGLNLRQKERQTDGSLVNAGRVLVRVTLTNRRYTVDVFDWKFAFRGSTTLLNAGVAGNDILNPFEFTGFRGAITGEAELVDGVTFTGGELLWDKTGFHVEGGIRVDCAEGAVTAGLTGDIVDDGTWKFGVSASTTSGCSVSGDLTLPTGGLIGEIESVDGDVTGLFEARGDIQTTVLPAGVDAWDAGFRFVYDGTTAGSYIEFIARAPIGVAQGRVAFDGTLALNADFTIGLSNSSVAFRGDIKRETPGGPVVYDVGGTANIAVNGSARVAGSVQLTNTQLSLSGAATLACPVSGSITGGVSADIPLTSTQTWALGISGGAGAEGCKITEEFALAAGTGLTGDVRSTDGVVSLTAEARARIETTLVPTKSRFEAGFAFEASQGAYRVAVDGSTDGARFSAAVASNGTFDLSFSLDDLALGGVTLGARGTIKRTVPGGAVAYTISGSLAGEAEVYNNLFLRGGSLGISSTGGLTFSGTARQLCSSGYLDATLSGAIVDGRNWAFSLTGIASSSSGSTFGSGFWFFPWGGWTSGSCKIGRAAKFSGNTFSAQMRSVSGVVSYSAGVRASKINLYRERVLGIGTVDTDLKDVRLSISNTCWGCQAAGKYRITVGATGEAEFSVGLFSKEASATVRAELDLSGASVRRVSLSVSPKGGYWFSGSVRSRLLDHLKSDIKKGLTT